MADEADFHRNATLKLKDNAADRAREKGDRERRARRAWAVGLPPLFILDS